MEFTQNFKETAILEVTTVIGCPVMCSFCPQVSLMKNYKIEQKGLAEKFLNFKNFKSIIDKVPDWVEIHFSGMSEPYSVKDCTEMMRYAIKTNHKISVYSTLVGASVEDILFLMTIQFNKKNRLVIHLPDDEKNFKAKITEKYYNNLKLFLSSEEIQKKILDNSIDFMSMSRKGLTDQKIKGLIPKSLSSFIAISRAGNLSNEKEKFDGIAIITKKKGNIFCTAAPLLNHNVLLPNGDIVLCCMDYSLKHKIGNLLEQSYESLFDGEKIKNIFSQLLEEDNELICRNCEISGYR